MGWADLQTYGAVARRARPGAVIYPVLYALIAYGTSLFHEQPAESAAFGAVLVALGLVRLALSRFYPRAAADQARLEAWSFLFRACVMATSLAWGLFCAWSLHRHGLTPKGFVALLATAGIASGSILSFSPILPLVVAQILLLLAPSAAVLLASWDEPHALLAGALIAIYVGFMAGQARRICATVLEDMEKSRLMKEQKHDLEEALQAKERFLAMMSHEVRTPLNGILGVTELILEENKDKPLLGDRMAVIRSSGENLLLVLNDILAVSDTARGGFELERERLDLRRCVTESVRSFEQLARRKRLSLLLSVEPGVPSHIRGDAARLRQLLSNLIGNALKFTDTGVVSVSVRGEPKGGELHELAFVVADTGIGIPEGDRERIFELFSRVDESNQRRFGGAGAGLAACRRICEGMGGTIRVESAVGRGSTFVATIVARAAPEGEGQVDAPTPLRILLVEDHPANQKLATAMLRKAGHTVTLAANGFEAVEAAEKDAFDAVLMDCQMPGMDGYEATRRIRDIERLKGLPIIAVTANALEGDREKCLAAGMDDYVTKPIRFQTLDRVLRKWTSGAKQDGPAGKPDEKPGEKTDEKKEAA